MAEFLHKKDGSSLWYFRRRYPVEVAKVVGKRMHMQSLQTTNKKEAERLSRKVSVQFDTICAEARLKCEIAESRTKLPHPDRADSVAANANADNASATDGESRFLAHYTAGTLPQDTDSVLASVPMLIRLGAKRVIEWQQSNPENWQGIINGNKSICREAIQGRNHLLKILPVQAQALLNGMEMAERGEELPTEYGRNANNNVSATSPVQLGGVANAETWPALCERALREYKHKVTPERHKLAKSSFAGVKVRSATESDIQDGLRDWCKARLLVVQPRSVKGPLDSMVAALRCVLPKLTAPVVRELQGVMQPRVGDRQSMPIQEIRAAVQAFKDRPLPKKVRNGYGGGASQFDAIAVEVLAVLGMRPRELIQARPDDLVTKVGVFGEQGLYLRLVDGKNRASEREIPLSDGTREVLSVQRLREMLEWQEQNLRSPHGAVSSFGTRFKEMTGGGTLYQMRHSWKDVAVNAGVDSELRERLMGHKVPGVSAAYGSGIPLAKGLEVLLLIRDTILGEKR